MKISTSKFEIIDSGMVIVPPQEYVEFEHDSLRFRFNFIDTSKSESEQPKPEITGTLESDEKSEFLSINVINYNGLFHTTTNTLEVGKVEGKKLSVMFSIATVGSGDVRIRLFNYTWYKSKE